MLGSVKESWLTRLKSREVRLDVIYTVIEFTSSRHKAIGAMYKGR